MFNLETDFNIIIIICSLILVVLIAVLVFMLVYDKRSEDRHEKREKKFRNIKEKSMLNEIDSKVNISKENKINTVMSGEPSEVGETVKKKNPEFERAMTKEERERNSNPFGVDMSRRKPGNKKYDENNKFFKN